MADWKRIEALDASGLESLASSASSGLETVADALKAIASVLDLLSKIAVDEVDPAREILLSLVKAIESTVEDLLSNNLAAAVHINLKWNPTWRYDRKDLPEKKNPDFVHDSKLPWDGNGLGGWLDELNASAYDTTNLFRPVTDEETAVRGFVFLLGITSSDELTKLKPLLQTFRSDWGDLQVLLDTEISLSEFTSSYQALTKLGSGMVDPYMQSLVATREGLKGFADPSAYLPTPGNYPIWASVPVAAVLPPTQQFFTQLQKLIATLNPSAGVSDRIAALASFLEQKAVTLEAIAEELSTFIDTIDTLLDLLNNGYFTWVEVDQGGFAAWINEVRNASPVIGDAGEVLGPDFGQNGLVAGVIGVSTEDDVANHLQTLFQLFAGYDLLPDTTTQAQQLADTYDDIFEGS